MRWTAGLLLVPALAHADDGIELHARGEQPPILVLDPTLASRFESLHADEQRDHAVVPVGRGVDAILDNTSWVNDDVVERGWRAAAGLTRDFGVARLTATASWNGVDGWLGGGRYVDLTIALTRTFKLSRWMTAWISLSVGVRSWTGTPPPGERNGAAVMLGVGTTFR
jgi:hypothetical protein